MGQNKRKRAFYPSTAAGWRKIINQALNLTPKEGATRYQNGNFPYRELEDWIQQRFRAKDGYAHNFIPALIRNPKGLVAGSMEVVTNPIGQDLKNPRGIK